MRDIFKTTGYWDTQAAAIAIVCTKTQLECLRPSILSNYIQIFIPTQVMYKLELV